MKGFIEERFEVIVRGHEKEILFPFAKISYTDDFLVRVVIADNTELELAHAAKITNAILFITGGALFTALYIAGNGVSYNIEILKYTRNMEKKHINMCARALYVNSLALRLVANFYSKFHKPEIPYKVFSSEEEAVKWLYTFKK